MDLVQSDEVTEPGSTATAATQVVTTDSEAELVFVPVIAPVQEVIPLDETVENTKLN